MEPYALYTAERRGDNPDAMKLSSLWSIPLCLTLLGGCDDTAARRPRCGDFASIALKDCDLESLSKVEADGVWNYEVQWLGATFQPGAMLLTPGAELLGGRAAVTEYGPRKLFISTSAARGKSVYRWSIAGCGATDADHFGGVMLYCVDGSASASGFVKATRLRRAPNEAESSGLSLVSEARVRVGTAADLVVAGGHAYVPALQGGLTVFDVRNPAQPVEVAQVAGLNDFWNDAKVQGTTLYVASANEGIIVYDVSNPREPRRLGATPVDRPNVHTIYLDGQRLYAASPNPDPSVLIYNIENPQAPVLLSRFRATGAGESGSFWPHDMQAVGNRLYVNHWGLGLVVADVTDPTKPKQLGSFSWPYNTSHTSAIGTFNGKTYAFSGDESWDGHLRVLDVTDPAKISQVAEVKGRPEISIHNIVLRGTKLYVSYYQEGVRVYDVSNPAAPVRTAYYNTWRESDPGRGQSFYEGAIGIRAPGDGFIYVAETNRGLMIFKED